MATPTVESSGSREPERERIDCSSYDLDRLHGSLLEAVRRWRTWQNQTPSNWNINEWLSCRLTPDEFEPISLKLAEMRAEPPPVSDYLSRQAFLTLSILHLPMWSDSCCRAAAYGQLRIGLQDHHCMINLGSVAGLLLATDPEQMFDRWGDNLTALTDFLYDAVLTDQNENSCEHHRPLG